MSNTKKRCKQCKKYQPVETMVKHPIGTFCDMACAILFAQDARQSDQHKKDLKAVRDKAVKHRADKERVKPLSKLLAETQAVVNQYVRLRDSDRGCVSCDKPAEWHGQWHASHFHARGKSSKLRFNLWNIHKSCSICNGHLSGNLREYEPELLKRIGHKRFSWMLEVATQPTRYTPDYLRRMKRIFSKKCRAVSNRSDH